MAPCYSKRSKPLSRSPSSTDKMLKLLGRMPWPGFEPQYLHLCVWVYNAFIISSIYQKKRNKPPNSGDQNELEMKEKKKVKNKCLTLW